jgi:hypothetical protein
VDFFSTTKGNHLYRFDKIAELQEKKYVRKTGLIKRPNDIRARRPPTPPPAPPKLEQLCLHFNTTGTSPSAPPPPDSHRIYISFGRFVCYRRREQLTYYLGECRNARDCRYTHNFSKVAICKDFLMTGNCSRHDCQLSHDPTPNRSPACIHFSRGNCTNPTCRYAHVKIDPTANVCREFAILGYCEKGADCADRHVTECPDYANTGTCSNKKCRLPHVDRAGQLRKIAGVPNVPTQPAHSSPKSASEEGEHDEADVDDSIESDEVDSTTFATQSLTDQSNDAKSSFSKQEDYIRL